MIRYNLRKLANFILFGVLLTSVSYVVTFLFSSSSSDAPLSAPVAHGDVPGVGGGGDSDADGCDADADADCDGDGDGGDGGGDDG